MSGNVGVNVGVNVDKKAHNKTVIITGASRGIGAATARLLVLEGWNVVLNYNTSQSACEALYRELTHVSQNEGLCGDVAAIKADVACHDEVAAMFSEAAHKFGKVDALVCNAGIALQKLFVDTSLEDFNRLFSVNVEGTFNCCKKAIPSMVLEKAGKIILLSSVWGITGASCEAVYSSTKAAIIGMAKSLAKELAPSNIQVNCVAPGVIDTDMNNNLNGDEKRMLANEIPLGRIGLASDVANIISFLLSDKSNYITGQVISPNGGFLI